MTTEPAQYSEADWEQFAIDTLGELGWEPLGGADLAPGSDERDAWNDLVLHGRFLQALRDFNPDVPQQYLAQAKADILSPKSQDAITENESVHGLLVGGYRGLSYLDADGVERHPTIRLMHADPDRNNWVAARQVTIRDRDNERRFDLVLYCNGLPVSIIELKKAGAEAATVAGAHCQLQTYLDEFPMAFRFAMCVVASDGMQARYGTPFTPLNHFAPWNVDDDGHPLAIGEPDVNGNPITELELTLNGLFNLDRFGQLLRDFTAFDQGEDGLAKRIAKPHQYFAVTKAVGSTIDAVRTDGRAGVVWHTQGSGKSMEMELYANRVMRHPRLLNPTIVVITDRRELDGQLYEAFFKSLLLPEQPQQIKRRADLRRELTERTTGGIYFTTLQKFGRTKDERDAGSSHPVLCDRRNVIVIVDEAHRSHYDDLDGYAWHLKNALPHATLIAFTGTPVSQGDRDTRKVFGDDIDVYDLNRAVEDGATVPVYFEPRLIRVDRADELDDETLDAAADEATHGLDDAERTKIEQSVAVINAVYGAPARLERLAADLVAHWEARRERMVPFIEMPGKAMIVCATRQIAVDLYDQIVALRPDWHSDDLDKGKIKVVFSGDPTDPESIRRHVRRPSQNDAIKKRLKDEADDELELVIVKDMMLTGYDSPPLHTLYLDRPIKGALLMQTLARVNRTFRGKEDGLLVAYAPLTDNLTKALEEYTQSSGGRDQRDAVGRRTDEAAEVALELVDQMRGVLADYDWREVMRTGGKHGHLHAVQGATNYLRSPESTQPSGDEPSRADRFRRIGSQLARARALASQSTSLKQIEPDLRFYEQVRVWMAKYDAADREANGQPIPEDVARLLNSLIVEATDSVGIVDIYAAAGLPAPSLSDLTPEFVEQATHASAPHLAIEALRASIMTEAGRVTQGNVVRQRAFSERLTELMTRYTNQQLTAAEVIAELVEMAKDVSAEKDRGKQFKPPLNTDELAYLDVVSTNESAVDVMGTDTLAQIARELVAIMQRDTRTDWTVRDDVRAKLRSSIKRLLIKFGYPPDKQQGAIRLVMEQMEAMAPRYAEERRRQQAAGNPTAE